MSAYRFLRDDGDAPAQWRALDRALAQWVRAHGGSDTLAHAAGWASFADGLGDAALPLCGDNAARHGMAPLDHDAIAALRGEAMVGDGSRATPFVLDAQARFALWRNHADEAAVAARVQALRAAPLPIDAVAVGNDLDLLFAHTDARAARQREAVESAASRRFFVLSGGPGTGKTSTVLRLLLLRLRAAPDATIRVAAPTGKAAQRLTQALRSGKEALRAALPADWLPLLEKIPDRDALTAHRLLGYRPQRNVFSRTAKNPVAADIVVVDEASMLDLAMLRALLDALRDGASLVLVGDADQLTSIATGSVLADLVAALQAQHAQELVLLEHSFRAERALAAVNVAVRLGDGAALDAAMAAAPERLRRIEVGDEAALRRRLRDWAAQLAALELRPVLPANAPETASSDIDRANGPDDSASSPSQDSSRAAAQADLFDAARASVDQEPDEADSPTRGEAASRALRMLAQQQLLCALREDRYGALAANALIETELKRRWNIRAEETWYPGRAVIVTRNDHAQQLFNGDVGLCLADADGELAVWFDSVDAHGRASARAIAPARLPAHESAFAITIHKSQGSEYGRVAVLLPPHAEHRILTRQLLYTGVSRARRSLELWATPDAIAAALARPVVRVGALADRLRAPGGDAVA